MQVYTFSTGGSRDGIYLDKLSTTVLGVKELLKPFLIENYLTEGDVIRDIFIDGSLITVVIDDNCLGSSFKKDFQLVSFECI
jgi:hypothetical protein